MAEILNLRMARKRRARADKEREADRNRILHGLPKAERKAASTERERALSALENHRREKTDGTRED
ncbi:DUF4169 family protein [Aquamicrobium sp. LC103]|uniref:DUF4169 family protein n=1 Tax=Aquamicrobium sp. LC103 TaxID=1120658 RepID=UPI00063EA189|nr:DUF4169 family protein [Aquamicrobium sp. LC103]TKT80120.1 DUF4169 family protein [Aquamicrobium sp. LC103]